MSNPLCHTARQQPPDAAHRPSPPPARHVLSQLFPDAHISCLCLPRGASRSGLAISNNPHSCKPRIASRAFVQSGFNELASLTPAAPSRERDLTEPSRFPNQIFNDSWVVGFWRADHGGHEVEVGRRAWTLAQAIPGSFRSQGAAADVSALYLGIDWTGRSQERPADGGAAGTGRV